MFLMNFYVNACSRAVFLKLRHPLENIRILNKTFDRPVLCLFSPFADTHVAISLNVSYNFELPSLSEICGN